MTQPDALPAITLDELERLIKLLGMLGSASDGEALAAARFVVRWIAEKDTSWEALLVPEEDAGVVSVGTLGADAAAQAAREAAVEQRVKAAFKDGFAQGIQRMAAQVKAQAAMGQQAAAQQAQNPYAQSSGGLGGFATGLGQGLGGSSASWQQTTGSAQQPAQQAPGASHAGHAGGPLQLNPYPSGTWKWVAWELLERGKSIPGVFRGSREQDFVRDVLGRSFPNLTQAQEVWLRDIAGRSGMSW